jgi:fimbrial chaperone protein
VIFEEIVRQQPSGSQIQVALRLNLPLYLLPQGGGKADVSWRAWRDSAGNLFIEANNRGSTYAQVLEIAARNEAGRHTILSQQMGVILPASIRSWKIGNRPDFGAGASMTLQIRSPTGDMQAAILVEQR